MNTKLNPIKRPASTAYSVGKIARPVNCFCENPNVHKANRNRGLSVVSAASLTLWSALGVFSQCGAFAADNLGGADELGAPKREWAASLRWENDTFGGTDRFYTDGIALSLSHTGPSWMDPTFKDSPSADKKFFVPAAGVGVSVGNRRFQTSFTFVFWGKEFDDQKENPKFGSLSVSYFF